MSVIVDVDSPLRLKALEAKFRGEPAPMVECTINDLDTLIKYWRSERVYVNWLQLADGRAGVTSPEGIVYTIAPRESNEQADSTNPTRG